LRSEARPKAVTRERGSCARNYEQFANRTVPFAGDYLWVSSVGGFAYAVWTDWRDTVAGRDPRERTAETTTRPTCSNAGR
jgi:hypothetical protein